jgi:bifunctional non-homologous end joining protein LigD
VSLEEYRRKRDFEQTPEPEGATPEEGGALRFVIQRHDATRLHYDLRLEIDGVLKSWAVPRGPSLDPADKRLAVRTEDHPLDYLDFEDVIPKGSYGAGTMIIWDRGTYRVPEARDRRHAEELMQRGEEKGKLVIWLEGEKVRGAFHLVRMRGEKNQWLLFKGSDEHAAGSGLPGDDRSVKSGLTADELRRRGSGEGPRHGIDLEELDLRGARKAPMPSGVEPMLATLSAEPFDAEDWIYEIKWDGFRAIAEVRRGEARLYSRSQTRFESEFAPLVRELELLDFDAVIDGEIVVLDEQGRGQFSLLQKYRRTGEGTLVYYAFDILHLEGYDLRSLPLVRRKELLARILPPLPRLRYSNHIPARGVAFFRQAAESGLEGVIAKEGQSLYRAGRRSEAWQKFKARPCQEAVIGGFTAPRSGRQFFGALLLGVYEDESLIYVGHTGTGFDQETLADLRARLEPLRRSTSPFAVEPKGNAPATWVEPELVCEVQYASWTESGILRQAAYLGLREDVDPRTVRREEITALAGHPPAREGQPADEAPPAAATTEPSPGPFPGPEAPPRRVYGPRTKKAVNVEAGGRQVPVTSLEKVLWPDDGLTKGDLIAYYQRMAPVIVPYLVDRPQSLHRFPAGIHGESFFHKDIDYAPDWVQTANLTSGSSPEGVNYLLCQDEATLVYMANLGCIELNPWNSRVGSLDQPDWLVFDLDPGEIAFREVVRTALAVHEILESLEVLHLPKTSGATGLHIYVPLAARYTYEQALKFGLIVGHLVHSRLPDITSLDRDPRRRRQKIYIDLYQNRRGQTLAAPYCLRPRPGAPVSTPLRWSEMTPDLDPRQFSIHSIQERVDALGDLWREVLGPGVDMEGALERLQELWQRQG